MKLGIDWEKVGGLVPAVVQNDLSGEVLMLAYMNQQALAQTIMSGRATFYSRSRRRLWTKGETSGNFLEVKSINVDCDADTLLVSAIPNGPTCHLGSSNCFNLGSSPMDQTLARLERCVVQRQSNPIEGSYTASLFSEGLDRIAQKVGEEAVEVVIASKNDDDDALIGECADLIYHLTVLMVGRGLSWNRVYSVLESREQLSR